MRSKIVVLSMVRGGWYLLSFFILFFLSIAVANDKPLLSISKSSKSGEIKHSQHRFDSPLEINLPSLKHPYLFLNAEELETIRKLSKDESTYQHSYIGWLTKRMDNWLGLGEVDIIPRVDEATSITCNVCGTSLANNTFDLLQPFKHRCGRCGEIMHGAAYDNAWRTSVQSQVGPLVRDLGMLYGVTGDQRYAQEAARILVNYADQYRDLPVSNMSRLGSYILVDNGWTLGMASGYDLIFNSGALITEQKSKIEEDLFLPAAALLMAGQGHYMPDRVGGGISNFRVATLSGVNAIGFLLRDEELVDFTLNGPVGVLRLLDEGVLEGGVWWEDSSNYFVAMVRDFTCIAETAWHSGINLYNHHKYRSLFQGALNMAYPDNNLLPATNDTSYIKTLNHHGFRKMAELYYARTGDKSVAPLLTHGKLTPISDARHGYDWMDAYPLWVTPTWPDVERPRKSMNLTSAGKAILRTDPPVAPIDLYLDYGPHGGTHGHYDKLGIILYANGRVQAPDPGIYSYSDLTKEYFRGTVAHNTIVVNQQNQTRSWGKCHFFGTSPRFKIADASPTSEFDSELFNTGHNKGQQRRIVSLVDESFIVDIFLSSWAETTDWVYHNFGVFQTEERTTPQAEALGKSDGYQFLKDLRRGKPAGPNWNCRFSDQGQGVSLTMMSLPDMEIITGQAPGIGDWRQDDPGTIPFVIARALGPNVWKTVIEPYQGKTHLKSFEELPVQGPGFTLGVGTFTGEVARIFSEGVALRIVHAQKQHFVLLGYTWGTKMFGDIAFNGQTAYLSYGEDTDSAKEPPDYLYIGQGSRLRHGTFSLQTDRFTTLYLQRLGEDVYEIENQGKSPVHVNLSGITLEDIKMQELDVDGPPKPLSIENGMVSLRLAQGVRYHLTGSHGSL